MAEQKYDNEMRVSLWPNRKREGKRDADFRGELQIAGRKYSIKLWQNDLEPGSRKPALSGSVSVWEESGASDHAPAAAPAVATAASDGDLPF